MEDRLKSESPRSPRPRDEIWDTLTEHFGEPRTKSERGRRNAAVRELRDAGARPDEIRTALEYCARTFTHFTEIAVCSWFTRALKEAESRSNVRELFRRMNP
jgi:hypothetical protein